MQMLMAALEIDVPQFDETEYIGNVFLKSTVSYNTLTQYTVVIHQVFDFSEQKFKGNLRQ